MTLPTFHTRLITTTVLPGMHDTWSNPWALVIRTAILRLKRLFSCCLTPFGLTMAIPQRKAKVGLVMPEHGSLMLAAFLVDFTSIRLVQYTLYNIVFMINIHLSNNKYINNDIVFGFCRIQGLLLPEGYGLRLMWALKYLLVTKTKWQNGA